MTELKVGDMVRIKSRANTYGHPEFCGREVKVIEVGSDGVILDLPVNYLERYYYRREVEKVETKVEELERWKASYHELKSQSISTIDSLERLRAEDKKEIEDLRGKLEAAETHLKIKESSIQSLYENNLQYQVERTRLMEEVRALRELVQKTSEPKRVPPKAFVLKDSSGETIAQGVEFDRSITGSPIKLVLNSGDMIHHSHQTFVQSNLEHGRTVHYED